LIKNNCIAAKEAVLSKLGIATSYGQQMWEQLVKFGQPIVEDISPALGQRLIFNGIRTATNKDNGDYLAADVVELAIRSDFKNKGASESE
jgi:hypothetical protein